MITCDAIFFLHVIIVIHMRKWTFYMWNFRGEKKKIAFEIVQFRCGIVFILYVKIVIHIWKKKPITCEAIYVTCDII